MSSSWFGGVIGRLWTVDGEVPDESSDDNSHPELPGERELTPTKYRLSKVRDNAIPRKMKNN